MENIPCLINVIRLIDQQIGFDNVRTLEKDLSSLSICHEAHTLNISFSPKDGSPYLHAVLPTPLAHLPTDTLSSAIQSWRDRLELLIPFFKRFEALDSEVWVLEPSPVTFAHRHRRYVDFYCMFMGL